MFGLECQDRGVPVWDPLGSDTSLVGASSASDRSSAVHAWSPDGCEWNVHCVTVNSRPEVATCQFGNLERLSMSP
jgi:hypothetical protein